MEKQKVILIRFGEIFLKGNNRYFFESILIENIKTALQDFDFDFVRSQNRYAIENFDEDLELDIIDALTKVFGIHSISSAYKIPTNMDYISKLAIELAPVSGTFRVTVNRADKRIPFTSTQIATKIGGDVWNNNKNLVVDLFNFQTEINIDIREEGNTYVFKDKILCLGGMPVGCSGQGMLLLSGGIDSPAAGFMMAKRGLRLSAIHFHSAPYTSEMAKEKVIDLAKIVKKYSGNIKLHVIPFTETQLAIHEKCPAELMITIMRRFMMRISERIAKKDGCGALITGESLGQVASQTMQSITVTNSVIEDLPVFRPLIGMDKTEIIKIANDINTYETSIQPYEDCCTIFLPKNPAIKPHMDIVLEAEQRLDIEGLIAAAISGDEVIDI